VVTSSREPGDVVAEILAALPTEGDLR
jgi:hypothetical protein